MTTQCFRISNISAKAELTFSSNYTSYKNNVMCHVKIIRNEWISIWRKFIIYCFLNPKDKYTKQFFLKNRKCFRYIFRLVDFP